VAMLVDSGVEVNAQRKDGRTAFALAVQSGQTETAALLEARGATTSVSPLDRSLAICATALHWACWKGYADLVELLLDHGASLTIEDEEFHGTPPGWFGHGVQACTEGSGDYPQVARLLIAKGALIPSVDLPTGKPEVDAVLRDHGLI